MASGGSDPIKARIQQSLQMDDLGTRRREFISTEDVRDKYSRVKIDQINATRASNQVGSEVQRLAEENKEQLNSWANAWKTIGGDVDLEELDPLMNGQSHRARLADQIKGYGGQSYGEEDTKKPTTRSSSRGGRGGGGGGGRGGGVIGTRGRGSNAGSRSMDHHGSNQTPEMKLGHHVVTPPTQPRRFLDPALDPDPKPYRQRSRSKRGRGTPSQEEKKNQQPKKRENRPIKAPTIRRPVAIAQSGSNFEHLLAPTTDFLAAIASISGDPPTKPAAVPAYSENSTFFSQGGDTTAKSKKVAESSKKTPNKESHKKGQAANEETPKKDHGTKENTPKKGSASKAPKKGPTPKQKQKQPVPSAPKADNKKPVTIPHGPKGGSKPEAPTAQPPPVEAKSTTPPPVAGPSNEDPPNIPEPLDESIAVKATTSNILDTEVPRTPNSTEGVVEFQANNSFASSLPQPEDEPDSEEDAAPDDLSDLLLDFSTPPSPGRKDKAPAKESGPAMGELVDLSSRAEADFFTGDTQQLRTYEGTCDTASLSAYPNFMGTTPEISAKQLELDQLKRFLNQEHGSDMFGYLTRRKAVLEEELAGMKKDHAAGNAVESESPVMDKIEKHNSQTLVDTSIPKVHVENCVLYQQQVGSNAAQISGLKISNLIGTHNLPGRSKTMETGTGSTPPDEEPKMEKGHERKSTVLSQSSTDTSGSRMRSKPYIPYSAAAMQYAPEYFKGLEEESKRIEELKDGVNALTLDSPTKNTVGHPVSPSPTPIPPKPEVTSNPVARTAPFFPDTAATRQYSRNFSNDPFVASSSDDQVRRTSATSTSVRSDKAPSKTSRLSPSVAPFQPSGMASTAMQSVSSATSGTTKPNVNEPKAGQGLYASKYATPSKPRVASGLEASKYAAPPVPKFEQKSTPPKYAYSPQRTPSQGIDASQYAQSPKRKASYGLDASKYAQPPKRPANQGLEASKYASPAKSQSGQGLGASKYASPSPTPKPGQGLYASKHAPPAKSQTGQGLEASKYESPSPTPKPNQGLYASKHAPPATTQSGQGLEASKYAFPAPKPEQGLYASKYAPLAKSQSGQGLEASRYASTSNSKPERGLFASKYAPQGGADMPEGLEDFKSGSYPRSRGHQRK